MFDHVTIRVSDPDASDRFYTTVLAVLGLEPSRNELGTEWGDFSMATDGGPVTRNLRIAFFAATPTLVDAFGVLLDPDGNRVEAVHDTRTDASTGDIARLWLRTNDIAAARRFYEAIGVSAALTFVDERPPTEHVHFAFPAATNTLSTRFTRPRSTRATRATAHPESAPSITLGTTERSCSTPTDTTSRSSTTIAKAGSRGRSP